MMASKFHSKGKIRHEILERIIVPLDRHLVVYTGGAGVDKGAGLDQGDVFYTGPLFCRDTGIGPLLHRQPV